MSTPIGVLVEARTLHRALRGRKTNERISLYRQIALDEQYPIVVFSILGLQLKKNRVTGYAPTPKGWKKVTVAMPRVIHKRVLYRESAPLTKLASLRRRGVILVNPDRMQNKAVMNTILGRDPRVKPHLPWTRMYQWDVLEKQLRAGTAIMLKPRIGSVGRGIIKINPLTQGLVEVAGPGQYRRKIVLKRLPKYLRAQIRPKRYMVQQYIKLARYKGNVFDLRVPVQRDETGTWQVPGMVAKVAGKHRFLTNIAQGGRALPAETAIKAAFSAPEAEKVMDAVQSLALAVAQTVSKTYRHAADLGLDIGVGADGKPWLIEVNTRDQRITFDQAGLPKAFRTLYRNPLAYCVYLNNTSSKGL